MMLTKSKLKHLIMEEISLLNLEERFAKTKYVTHKEKPELGLGMVMGYVKPKWAENHYAIVIFDGSVRMKVDPEMLETYEGDI